MYIQYLLFESEAMRRATCSWLRFPTEKSNFRPQMISASAILLNEASMPDCLTTPTMQIIFFIFFLIHYTLASDFEIIRSRDQGYPLANTPVESFLIDDSELTRPSRGDQPILTYSDTISETNPSSQDQTWIEDVESLFMVGIPGTHCTNKNAETSLDQLLPPSRFQRRSSSSSSSTPAQSSNREESKTSCINSETAHELVNTDPRKPERKPDPPNRDRTPRIFQDMLMLVRMYGSLSQKFYEKGCGGFLVPICAPLLPERQYPPVDESASEMVVPVRFCG